MHTHTNDNNNCLSKGTEVFNCFKQCPINPVHFYFAKKGRKMLEMHCHKGLLINLELLTVSASGTVRKEK